jgi:5,10-methylenetetrahydrofolate reductase
MAKVTEALSSQRQTPVFICDFSPPRGGGAQALADASQLDADFICVAYNPGKAVRVDSVSAAYEISRATGRGTVFNLSPRDMNKLALQSRLLGAQTLGLQNLLVIQGDPITDRDGLKPAGEYTATGLIASIRQMNQGLDYKGSKLRAPTEFCIGASLDLSRGIEREASLAYRKAEAGAHFFVSQPVFEMSEITSFLEAYEAQAGTPLSQPVFWGLQILAADGVLFSTVPENLRRDLANGRDGVEIALQTYKLLREAGIGAIYLVSPIMRGGARDYAAAARFLAEVSAS